MIFNQTILYFNIEIIDELYDNKRAHRDRFKAAVSYLKKMSLILHLIF